MSLKKGPKFQHLSLWIVFIIPWPLLMQIKRLLKRIWATKDLVVSFHGLPKRRVLNNKDPYYEQCFATFNLIGEDLKGVNTYFSFQSRFGSEEWLTPSTEECVLELISKTKKKLRFVCPSFVSDCLETTDEIGHELKKLVEAKGARLKVIPCVNFEVFLG